MNPLLRHDRHVRWLHPVAWWVWAICAAAAASTITNPLLLAGISLSALLVVINRGVSAPWAASVSMMLRVAALLIALRVLMQTVLGAPVGTHVLGTLPQVGLPTWMSGIRLGGVVTWESVLIGLSEGMRFAAILMCIAAATTVAAPSRLFRALPARAADLGTLLIVAMTMVPHLVQDFRRIAAARRLRGRSSRGLRAISASLTPVVDGAMERSMQLASSMFSRGYGSGKRRTRHRPEPWRPVELAVLMCGAATVAVTAIFITSSSAGSLSIAPLAWPTLTPAALACLACIAAPAFITPNTPATEAPEF